MADTYRLSATLATYEAGVLLSTLTAALTDVEVTEFFGPVSQRIANGDSWSVQHPLATVKAIMVVTNKNVALRLAGEGTGHQITVPDGQTKGVFFMSCNETQLAFDNNSGAEAKVQVYLAGD